MKYHIETLPKIFLLILLYLTSLYSYLLFHNLSELFSIIIAFAIYMIAFNSKKYMGNSYLIFIAIAYLFVGIIDLLHTLSYKGMQIFKDYDYYANQLWIAARYMESISLLFAYLYLDDKKKVNTYLVSFIYFIVSSILIASIFYFKVFPVCFIDGIGLTPFKKISEYIICLILTLNLIILCKNKKKFDEEVFYYLYWSIIFTIISELAFTFYIDNYGFSNLIGHYFKIFAFYCIYKAIIQTSLVRPYDIIFRELKEAKESAEIANKAKSDFLSNMSHELRTPLNAVLGYAQILKKDSNLTESQINHIDIIDKSGKHLLNLINEVLDLAKIEARKIDINKETFIFIDFLNTISDMIKIKTFQKGIEFYSEFDENLPYAVIFDEKRLGQILINLLGNAVKFTEKGCIKFKVTALENKKIRFQIEDTGIGIPEQNLKDIFSPFVQIGEKARKIEGTGLGLTISQRLVRLMDSELNVKSTFGIGSLFWFDIEIEKTENYLNQEAAKNRNNIIGFKGEKKIILVVDDIQENRMLLIDLLSKVGFDVYEASNGKECLEKAHIINPDLIFMDIVMPVMSGLEAIEQIRDSSELKSIKVIVSSASPSTPNKEELFTTYKFDDFIFKPIEIQNVFDTIQNHLNISWIYEEKQEKNIQKNEEHQLIIVPPPKPELDLIYKLSKIGDLIELKKELERIEKMDNKYLLFTDKINGLLKTFQIKQVQKLIEKYMGTYVNKNE
ncbi:MAG: response regulator [Desulfobacterales bacterium]|nr:response regulator [Desulfobacterales bacterium]